MKIIFFLSPLLLIFFISSFGQIHNTDGLKQQLSAAKDNTDKVDLLFNLSNSYLLSYADTSAYYAKQGVLLAGKINYKIGEISCMHMLCVSLANLGNFTSALDFGFKSLTLAKKIQNERLIIYSNNVLMSCYLRQEDYNEALIYGNNAKKLITIPYADSAQAYIVFSILSSLYEKTNQMDSALLYAERSFSLSKKSSEIYRVLGDIHAKMGKTDLALNYYREGISVAKREFTYVELIDIYNDMSKIFKSIGKTDSAIFYADKSIIQEGIHAHPEGVLSASKQLAGLYESKKIPDSTIKYLKLASALNDSLFSRGKTREAQSLSFNEKLHQQELASQKKETENKIRVYALFVIISIFSLVALLLWRNNVRKQKLNAQLNIQKQEIQNTLTELKSTQSQLIQSEKMASLGELTAGIAHEIQNPLNFVNNFSELNAELIDEIQKEMDNEDFPAANKILSAVRENEGKITQHGKRADAIVKSMLQHSKVTSGKKETVDVNSLANEYLRLAYHGIRAKENSFNTTMNTYFDDSIGKIEIIPQDIGRVLLNLYNNAFYSVGERKNHQGDGYEPTISVSTKKISDMVLISVKDNGGGVPYDLINKVFQPFFTTKPAGQGTGLGLSLSYDIMKAHGGELKVITPEGEGAEFIVQIPLSKIISLS